MAEKQQHAAAAAAAAGESGPQPTTTEYKKSQARVRELVEKRRLLERRLSQVEDGIAQKESAYLENTPSGNIITGFDNYMKGISGAAAQRRKTGPMDLNRVFSRSSISYRPNVSESTTPGSTPGSLAPTPVSASFSASTANGGGGGGSKNPKKKKQQLQQQETEDSENDTSTSKKRTAFGASRK
ncbi:Histone H4 acetyltransferase, NuA4 complex, Eaf6 [Cordyceps militaris CM01]|uniref:Chromatin modification-related protein EAF6 n=1 Tax=Cordyceps militaris (strain CM01) TaxID=983644 RepID=G3JJ89_CORMM|nr:Histone H4 acetyltransferase, NuA4 complex, Eaf6 [Cordyceps militaris CM01]EGX92031.1 Histone H4 acetyltransferase, NuA4 complex, Eaf6 [Cordyceps militaris CM01]